MVQMFRRNHKMPVDEGDFKRLVFSYIHDYPYQFKLNICGGDDSQASISIGFSGKETFVKEFGGKNKIPFTLSKEEIEDGKLVIHQPLSLSYPDVDGMLEFKDDEKKYLVFFQTTFQTPQEHSNNESRRYFFELEDNQYLALDDMHLNTRTLNKHDKVQCFKIYQRFIKETNKDNPNHNFNDLEELKSFLETVDEDDKLRELIKTEFVLGDNEEFGQEENEIKKIFDIKKEEEGELEKKWERVNTFLRDVKKEKRALELKKKNVRLEDYETYFVWIVPHIHENESPYKSKNGS